jgi:hypothetical protein
MPIGSIRPDLPLGMTPGSFNKMIPPLGEGGTQRRDQFHFVTILVKYQGFTRLRV